MNALRQVETQIVTASYVVPMSDSLEFARLPEDRRNEVSVTLRLLERVQSLCAETSLHQACLTVAAASQHLMRGCSAVTLRRKFDAYKLAGNDWRSLVLGYKGSAKQVPAEFLSYVRCLTEENQRSMAAAFDLIRSQWREGHPIPGYGTWAEYYMSQYPERPLPKHCPSNFVPMGWSDRTLYRKAPSKGARMLYQRGYAAAKKYFPSTKRDPSGLRPLELVVIDDFELDCLCLFPGDSVNKPQIGRIAGLLVIDVASRKKLHWGLGQRLERDEVQADGTTKTVRTGINRLDVQNLIHGLFSKYGLPGYQVTILCENAAASISPELELALSTLFEGRVKVERTGLIQHHTLTNGFTERGGRPWDKGWIESMFNALWNQLGNMPGYKGNNARLNAPGDLNAKLNYTRLLIGQGERALNLPPEQIALLRMPFPSPEAATQSFAWACSTLDTKTDHKYIGFDRVTEFELAEGTDPVPFSSLQLLTQQQQLAVKPIERMESPLERWARLSVENPRTAIPQAVLALLLLTPKRATFRNSAVTFVHNKEGFSYVDADGKVLSGISEGTEFLGYFDSHSPEYLHLATLQGAYVGTLTRLGGKRGMVDIRDKEAIKAVGAVQAKILNRAISEVRERHSVEQAQLAQDRAHNDAIVAAHKASTTQLSNAERIALAAGDKAAEVVEKRQQDKALSRADELDATALF